jgi:hypothetical protein
MKRVALGRRVGHVGELSRTVTTILSAGVGLAGSNDSVSAAFAAVPSDASRTSTMNLNVFSLED